jgi:hypothetical protein
LNEILFLLLAPGEKKKEKNWCRDTTRAISNKSRQEGNLLVTNILYLYIIIIIIFSYLKLVLLCVVCYVGRTTRCWFLLLLLLYTYLG